MSEPWQSTKPQSQGPITLRGWIRIMRRGLPVIILIAVGFIAMIGTRMIERPLYGARRPVTQAIVKAVCRVSLWWIGLRYDRVGQPMAGPGAVVANHTSWLDIFALNAGMRIFFVAKSEVAGWPGIGLLARATGTAFVERKQRAATTQVTQFRSRLAMGHKLLFFPEGTSTDGLQVLPFKPTLFAAFFDPALIDTLQLQAVSISYTAPNGADPRFYGWWGDMDLAPHLLHSLSAANQGAVQVVYHPPVNVRDYDDRKSLAKAMQITVAAGVNPPLPFEN